MKVRPMRRWSWKDFWLLTMVLPGAIWLLLIRYLPMLGVVIAFKKFIIRDGIWGSPWVGLAQFEKFFRSYNCWRIISNSLTLSLYTILAGFPIPILFALLLNCVRNERYKKTIQTITYMPHFISTVVIVGMINQFLNPRIGMYGVFANALTGQYPPDLLGISGAFPHLYVWTGVWQSFGWGSIVYLAALTNSDPQLHEAAIIDGASRWQRILYVDLPCIIPTATIMLIMRAGSVMSLGFEKAYLMQNNLNLSASEIISTYVYKVGMGVSLSGGGSTMPDYSLSTAVNLFNSVINLILICSVNGITRRMSETSLW